LERYQAPLYGFLRRRVGDAWADDLFQESWLRVSRSRQRFDPRRRFSTWLFQIANNLCRDRWRREAVERRTLEGVRREAREAPLEADAAGALSLRQEMATRIAALPERLREVLVLRYYQELSEKEAAQVLGIPRGTVKSRLHAALGALRRQEEAGDVA